MGPGAQRRQKNTKNVGFSPFGAGDRQVDRGGARERGKRVGEEQRECRAHDFRGGTLIVVDFTNHFGWEQLNSNLSLAF